MVFRPQLVYDSSIPKYTDRILIQRTPSMQKFPLFNRFDFIPTTAVRLVEPSALYHVRLREIPLEYGVLFQVYINFQDNFRGGYRRVATFLSESNTFHIKSKAIKMLSCKRFATLPDPPLNFVCFNKSLLPFICLFRIKWDSIVLGCVSYSNNSR